jgi:hypothetical protein
LITVNTGRSQSSPQRHWPFKLWCF